MRERILVTGFVPFSGHRENISEKIVELLSDKCNCDGIETSILSVDEDGSKETSDRIRGNESFRAILHLGLSENSNEILLERFARNHIQMRIPDNSGRIQNSTIVRHAKELLETNSPTHTINELIEGIESVRWSEDPGSFVCNETYFRTLLAVSETGNTSTPVLFMHLPKEEKISINNQLRVVMSVCRALES